MSNAYQIKGAPEDVFLEVLDINIDSEEAALNQINKTIVASAVDAEIWKDPEELVGKTLAERYAIQSMLGDGGMGAVYAAEHVLIRKRVAVKVLSPDFSRNPRDVQRFLLEARAASMIEQENVVDITDFGYTKQGQAFLVMEYLDGEDLSETLKRETRLEWRRVLHIASQVAAALEAAHAEGVIHRDIKPENFFRITRHKDHDFIKVLDFGIAKLTADSSGEADAGVSMSAGLVGTPEYIAPELLTGIEADVRVDIYAIGVVMYQLLTGATPFSGTSLMEILSQTALDDATPPRQRAPDAEIPEGVEAIVMRAIAREPEQRFQSAEALREAIDAALNEEAEAKPAGALWSRTRALLLLALAPLLALALLLALRGVWSSDEAEGVASEARASAGEADARSSEAAATDDPEPGARARDSDGEDAAGAAATAKGPDDDIEDSDTSEGAADDDDDAGDTNTNTNTTNNSAKDPEADSKKKRRPGTLSDAAFRRKIQQTKSRIRRACGELGIAGMKVTLEVRVGANGRVKQAIPQGTMAGSSLGDCVAREVKRTRFKAAQRSSVHTTILSI